MAQNPFALNVKPVDLWGTSKKEKRSLGVRKRQILYNRAKGRCENCGKKISFSEMQAGHKNKPRSKGGKASMRNSVCVCYTCNKLQGTDSWTKFRREQGKKVVRTSTSSKKRKSKRKSSKRETNPFSFGMSSGGLFRL